MVNAIKVVVNQFLKGFDKAPGWFPLLVTVFLWLYWLDLPEKLQIRGRTVPLSAEVIASIITFIMYQLGDAIDDRVFKEQVDGKTRTRKRYKDAYTIESTAAQNALKVGESGLYALANKLTSAADEEREAIFIYVFNEVAKFLRSFILPFFIYGVLLIVWRRFDLGVLLILLSGFALGVYPWLKVEHIRRLYRLTALVAGNKKLEDMGAAGVRLFFWEGEFIDAGVASSQAVPTAEPSPTSGAADTQR
jgi:hypothetical protein